MQTAFNGMIILPEEFPALMLAAGSGNKDAEAIASVIVSWFRQAAAVTNPNKTPLCLDCDTSFTSAAPPTAFAILMPIARGGRTLVFHKGQHSGDAVVTGICERCTQRPDLLAAAMRRWREIIPDADFQSVHRQAGHS
jgi:hypothetical protein